MGKRKEYHTFSLSTRLFAEGFNPGRSLVGTFDIPAAPAPELWVSCCTGSRRQIRPLLWLAFSPQPGRFETTAASVKRIEQNTFARIESASCSSPADVRAAMRNSKTASPIPYATGLLRPAFGAVEVQQMGFHLPLQDGRQTCRKCRKSSSASLPRSTAPWICAIQTIEHHKAVVADLKFQFSLSFRL